MTDLKFQLLSILYDSPNGEQEVDLLNRFPDKITDAYILLKKLKKAQLVECVIGTTRYKITSDGETLYENFKESHDKDSENKRQQRFQNKISIASVFVPLITFILGLIVEHFGNFIGFFTSLFKQLHSPPPYSYSCNNNLNKENRKKAVYSEVKYWITTAIAIAAFIKSFSFI